MVSAGLVFGITAAALIWVFRDQITGTISGGFDQLNKSIQQAGAGAQKTVGDIDTSIRKAVIDPVKVAEFDAKARAMKETEARDLGFQSVEEFEKKTDPNRIQSIQDVTKFNPPNTVGFGIKSINEGKGLPDTPENRLLVLQSQGISTEKTLSSLAQESKNTQEVSTKVSTTSQNLIDPNRPLNLTQFANRFGGQQTKKVTTQQITSEPKAPTPQDSLNPNTGTGTSSDPFKAKQPDKTLVSPLLRLGGLNN